MPNKTFISGFASGVILTLAIFVLFSYLGSSKVVSMEQSHQTRMIKSAGFATPVPLPAYKLDSDEGYYEMKSIRQALESIDSTLKNVARNIDNLEDPLDKIADKR